MAKFVTGMELNSEIEKIFKNATEYILLISPYIKLHDRYAHALSRHKDNPSLEITVVFGKNENNLSRSMKLEDFEFFKKFPNIEIRYEKRLHAKYYANESSAILTSMNLYSYSQDNNIEAGVMTKTTMLSGFSGDDNLDNKALDCFENVVNQSELLFKKEPQVAEAFFGLKKTYSGSKTIVDKLSDFFSGKLKTEFGNNNNQNQKTEPRTSSEKAGRIGYCIRTGKQIPFNTEKPFSEEGYKSWKRENDKNSPEKFCHFSGEPSNGETSFLKPVLRKNWNASKA